MEYELDHQVPTFQEELNTLMKTACIVKIHGWNRVKNEPFIVNLIKEHSYTVQSYTVLNCAKLMPHSN